MLLIGKLSFGLAVFACAAHESGLGDVVVASPSFLDGDTSAVCPFLIQQARLSSMRYQQVYCASDFSRISPHGGWIRWIELVPVGSLGGASICSSILISLSTTPKSQDNLRGGRGGGRLGRPSRNRAGRRGGRFRGCRTGCFAAGRGASPGWRP